MNSEILVIGFVMLFVLHVVTPRGIKTTQDRLLSIEEELKEMNK